MPGSQEHFREADQFHLVAGRSDGNRQLSRVGRRSRRALAPNAATFGVGFLALLPGLIIYLMIVLAGS
jgi:hypothetical protein